MFNQKKKKQWIENHSIQWTTFKENILVWFIHHQMTAFNLFEVMDGQTHIWCTLYILMCYGLILWYILYNIS